uniref:Uncharacterized protein n=1 Tax=Megaselia scalaris TaxID=36166 RepID=T1GP62_MEGSC
MRAFVFVSLFAVGLCGLLPGGYNYNGGSSFNHQGLVGPIFAGSNNVPSIGGGSAAPGIGGGLSAPGIGGGLSAPGIGGGLSAPGVSGPSGSYAQQPIGSPSIGSPAIAPQFPSVTPSGERVLCA